VKQNGGPAYSSGPEDRPEDRPEDGNCNSSPNCMAPAVRVIGKRWASTLPSVLALATKREGETSVEIRLIDREN
jgi:hypothetical protein